MERFTTGTSMDRCIHKAQVKRHGCTAGSGTITRWAVDGTWHGAHDANTAGRVLRVRGEIDSMGSDDCVFDVSTVTRISVS